MFDNIQTLSGVLRCLRSDDVIFSVKCLIHTHRLPTFVTTTNVNNGTMTKINKETRHNMEYCASALDRPIPEFTDFVMALNTTEWS
jgi:hypothetical protein